MKPNAWQSKSVKSRLFKTLLNVFFTEGEIKPFLSQKSNVYEPKHIYLILVRLKGFHLIEK